MKVGHAANQEDQLLRCHVNCETPKLPLQPIGWMALKMHKPLGCSSVASLIKNSWMDGIKYACVVP